MTALDRGLAQDAPRSVDDRTWSHGVLSALVDYATSDFDEGQPTDLFEPLVAMLCGPEFGYRGAAVYRDEPSGWHRIAGRGEIAQLSLSAHTRPARGTVGEHDLRLELAGGGGGWVLLIRRDGESVPSADERDLLDRLVRLVNSLLDQTTYTNLLTQSERHYRHLYSHANLGIFFSRVGAGPQRANPGMLGMLGYATEREFREAVTSQLNNHFYDPPSDRERLVEQLMSQGQVRDFHTRMRRSDGSLVPVSMTANLVQDPDRQGEDLEFFGFITDLSSDESRDEARRGLRRAQADSLDKVRFLAAMSHELRTPLNGVMGMAELLTGSDLDAESAGAVAVIQKSARQLLEQVDRMQDFTRMETGSLVLDQQVFSPTEMVAGVRARWRPAMTDKDLDLSVVLEPGADDRVTGDPRRCAQILDLLIENAVKFTDRGGSVRILVAPDGEALRLGVTDTGCGMDDRQLTALLDREPPEDSCDELGGAGLGLAMVRHLVDLMDGRLWIDSDPGRGSTFSVLLPLPREATAHASFMRREAVVAARKVLVVEDNPINQLVARKLLESLQLDVTVVAGGREAVLMAGSRDFDLVFMDLQMPGLDGFETTRALRAEVGYTGPVVAMTAHATQHHRDKCRHSGLNGFVTKPLERKRLADFLASLPEAGEESGQWLWLEPDDNRPLAP
ncbi:MAG: response regulator [Candidatus Krumholzibacteriia bacterium]